MSVHSSRFSVAESESPNASSTFRRIDPDPLRKMWLNASDSP